MKDSLHQRQIVFATVRCLLGCRLQQLELCDIHLDQSPRTLLETKVSPPPLLWLRVLEFSVQGSGLTVGISIDAVGLNVVCGSSRCRQTHDFFRGLMGPSQDHFRHINTLLVLSEPE